LVPVPPRRPPLRRRRGAPVGGPPGPPPAAAHRGPARRHARRRPVRGGLRRPAARTLPARLTLRGGFSSPAFPAGRSGRPGPAVPGAEPHAGRLGSGGRRLRAADPVEAGGGTAPPGNPAPP